MGFRLKDWIERLWSPHAANEKARARKVHDFNLMRAFAVTEGREIERQCIRKAMFAAKETTALAILQSLPPIPQPDITCACVCRCCAEGDHCGTGKQEGLGDCFYPEKE